MQNIPSLSPFHQWNDKRGLIHSIFKRQQAITQGFIETFCRCFVFKQKTCFGVYRNLMVQRKTVFEA